MDAFVRVLFSVCASELALRLFELWRLLLKLLLLKFRFPKPLLFIPLLFIPLLFIPLLLLPLPFIPFRPPPLLLNGLLLKNELLLLPLFPMFPFKVAGANGFAIGFVPAASPCAVAA